MHPPHYEQADGAAREGEGTSNTLHRGRSLNEACPAQYGITLLQLFAFHRGPSGFAGHHAKLLQ